MATELLISGGKVSDADRRFRVFPAAVYVCRPSIASIRRVSFR
jgi:hypothetical protein